MSALYTHPIDAVIGNIIPDGIGIYLLGGHPYTIRFWVIGAIFFTIIVAHSNFMNLSETHDDHHKFTNYNYGNGFFMDKLFGTQIHALKNNPSGIFNIKNRLRNRNRNKIKNI